MIPRKNSKYEKTHLLGNKLLSYVISILFGQKITDVMTGYKVFRKKVFDDLEIKSSFFQIEVELVSKILEKKYCIVEVPINYTYRKKGESKIKWNDGFSSLLFLLKEKSKKSPHSTLNHHSPILYLLCDRAIINMKL